ncbi:MAG: AraC family transcriptional regulator, partial [Verrucomicrobiae bacterium]|nr:AraC family transcriptional regulator [Verrucomicrobiae bacterium]
FVAKGTVEWKFEGKRVTAGPGTVTYTWPWQEHAGGMGLAMCEIYWVQIRLDRSYKTMPSRPRFQRLLGFPISDEQKVFAALKKAKGGPVPANRLIKDLMPRLVQELESPGPMNQERSLNMARQILIELALICLQNAGQESISPAIERVRAFEEILTTQLEEPWTLDAMAAKCGLGRTQFAEYFSREFGETPLRHLSRLRIEKAKELLGATPRSVTDIGFDCGFSSSQHFARVFRQFAGRTPTHYREKGEGVVRSGESGRGCKRKSNE